MSCELDLCWWCDEPPTLDSVTTRINGIVADVQLVCDDLSDQVRTNSERGVNLLADLQTAQKLQSALQDFAK